MFADLVGGDAFVVAVVPFAKIRVDRGLLAESGQLGGVTGALERAGEDEVEVLPGQRIAELVGGRSTVVVERNVRAPGVPAGRAPVGLAVSGQPYVGSRHVTQDATRFFTMRGQPFTANVSGGQVSGWVAGTGTRVLLLHGGPGMSYDYLDDLAGEIGEGYEIASYQQRGIAPSMLDGPFDIDTHLADVRAVLDALGWPMAYVVGHSWGGHLGFHVALALPDRLSGVLCLDPLGAVGDGGMPQFASEMSARMQAENQARAQELDEQGLAGDGTDADALERMRLVWPSYFAEPAAAPPMPPLTLCTAANAGGIESLMARLPELEAALPTIAVPLGIVAGARSPMPIEPAAIQTAARIPGAWVEAVEGAGHLPWVERPGCVRSALERLAKG
jgi:pimeloyl-ACP methyl ester carboxylesterase